MRFEEELKNYLKTSDWKYQKSIDQGFDKLKDPVSARGLFDLVSGLGTNNVGLTGIIRNPAKSIQLADQNTAYNKIMDYLHRHNEGFTYNGDNEYYLSDDALRYLTKSVGNYYQHIGTPKDPVYKMIEKGIINSDNIDTIGSDSITGRNWFDEIRREIANNPEAEFLTRHTRNDQGIANPYYNNSPEKKAVEEFYDTQLLSNNVLTRAFDGGKLGVMDYTKVPAEAGFFRNLNEFPSNINDAINAGFLKDKSLASARISNPDFMKKLVEYKNYKNSAGLSEWQSTEPVLDVGDYEWHKLPYDVKAQLVEGRKMHNCVGDLCQAIPNERDIYSLRWKETNTPKLNLSFIPSSDNYIEQILGISNSAPKNKYYDAVKKLQAYLGLKFNN